MKVRIFLIVTLLMATIMASAQTREERANRLKVYGLETCVDNPVFTIPPHEMSEAAQEAAGPAGVCRTDGVAYTSKSLQFGGEWHFAPKLLYCDEEKKVLPKVVCVPHIQEASANAMVLKVMAWKTPTCGAVVVYRLFVYGVDHFVATYDSSGKLVDAMYINGDNEVDEMFAAKNNGGFKTSKFGTSTILERSDDGKHFFVRHRKIYDKLKGDVKETSAWAEIKECFSVGGDGLIVTDSVVTNDEFPAVNSKAMELYKLRAMPLSAKGYMSKHCKLATALKGTELELSFMRWNYLKVISDAEAFLGWCKRNPKASVNIAYYLNLVKDNGDGEIKAMHLRSKVACLPQGLRTYWSRRLKLDQ